jgi:hypothetical protein
MHYVRLIVPDTVTTRQGWENLFPGGKEARKSEASGPAQRTACPVTHAEILRNGFHGLMLEGTVASALRFCSSS